MLPMLPMLPQYLSYRREEKGDMVHCLGIRARARGTATTRIRRDIEDALRWAYGREMVDAAGATGAAGLTGPEAAADGVAMFRASADGCADVLRTAELGCAVRVGHRWLGGGAHADGEAIHAAVMRLARAAPATAALVRECARVGERPEWRSPVRAVGWDRDGVPFVAGCGRLAKVMVVRGSGGALYCPVRFAGGALAERASRARYDAWWRGLEWLVAALAGACETMVVVGPAAPRAPWGNEGLDIGSDV